MRLGANKSVIFDKIFKAVTSNIKYAENGSNQIHTYINGYKVTIRFYFKDGQLKSLDAFMGWASRVIGNLIK